MSEQSASSFEAIYNMAIGAAQAGDFALALTLFNRAIVLEPKNAETFYKRGNALKNLGRLSEAVASYDQAIELKNDYAHAYTNRGEVQQTLGLLSEAIASYDRAISVDPRDAIAHYNRAIVMQTRADWNEALKSYDRAVSADPEFADAQYNRSVAMLFCGDFKRGWQSYEWRWKNAQRLKFGKLRDFMQPLWLGQHPVLGKRLLLHAEGGLGDTLQFCRYATLLAAKGATVIIEVPGVLVGLLGSLDGVAQVIAAGNALPKFDYHCPLMSLPLAFGTTLDDVPATRGYLRCKNDTLRQWSERLIGQGELRVGLAWSGNPSNTIDRQRSIRLSQWLPHLPRDFQYFCLQKDIREEDRAVLESSERIRRFDQQELDFENTAAICMCMDIVITVDTSVAHLSAALGQKTWILLPFSPDWRWLQGRSDCPWYPTVMLYRQNISGDWDDVLSRVGVDMMREFRVSR